MRYELYQPLSIHEIGQRANQEDALWPLPEKATVTDRLFIVCDGMGGHEKGEVASQTISQAFGRWFQEHNQSDEPFTYDQQREALAYAYEQLDQQDDGSLKKMGTTLTLIHLHRKGITAVHIGDSRIYHIRPSEGLKYVSRDHSLVFDLYQAGEITYEEMQTSPQKNIITRAMQPGEENRVRPDIIQITDIRPGDYLYLCSDGMLEQMSNGELARLLSTKDSDEEKRRQLIEATASNKDNHTAWLIHFKAVVQEEGDDMLINEEPTSRCNALNIVPPPPVEVVMDADVNTVKYDDDVVIVAEPMETHPPRHSSLRVRILTLVIGLLTVFIAWLLFGSKNLHIQKPKFPFGRDTLDSTRDKALSPFLKVSDTAGTIKDSLDNDTTGNQ